MLEKDINLFDLGSVDLQVMVSGYCNDSAHL